MPAMLVVDDAPSPIIPETAEALGIRGRSGPPLGDISSGFTSEDSAIAPARGSSSEPRRPLSVALPTCLFGKEK